MSASGLVLASGSGVRRRMLAQAGLVFRVDPGDVDEAPRAGEGAFDRARRLAREKALAIAERHPGALVIGSDQVGLLDDETELEKRWDEDAAVAQLLLMAGRQHTFLSAAALVEGGRVVAEVEAVATVCFRPFDEKTARRYSRLGEWQGSCGSYQIEGRGAQLVESVQGPLEAVLGMPLFGLLSALRRHAPNLPGLF